MHINIYQHILTSILYNIYQHILAIWCLDEVYTPTFFTRPNRHKFLMLRSLRSTETNPNTAGEKTPRAAAAPVDVPAQVLAPRNLPTRPARPWLAKNGFQSVENSSCLCLLDYISSDQFYPLGCSNMLKPPYVFHGLASVQKRLTHSRLHLQRILMDFPATLDYRSAMKLYIYNISCLLLHFSTVDG